MFNKIKEKFSKAPKSLYETNLNLEVEIERVTALDSGEVCLKVKFETIYGKGDFGMSKEEALDLAESVIKLMGREA